MPNNQFAPDEFAPSFELRFDLSELRQSVHNIRTAMHKVIVGQENLINMLIAALLADGHVLIEGAPGIAKTLAAKLLAQTINTNFSRIQFTPDLMPADVLGTTIFNAQQAAFEFKKGPIFSNVILIDEINRAPAKTQAALFEVMEEQQITIEGITYPLASPFNVLATQNPIEQEGTYRLPEAQLDRFLIKVNVSYPDLQQEKTLLSRLHHQIKGAPLKNVTAVINTQQLQTYRNQVRKVFIDERLLHYIAAITHQSRNHVGLYLGASPRASLAIAACAKALAAMSGRDFVTPDNVKAAATPVLRHRIVLSPDKEIEGIIADSIIQTITRQIEIPR